MRDVDKPLATLTRLKALGVKISIDDFGTRCSSLNAAIIKAIISLAHILNLRVVAEGVEFEAQNRFLKENHCDEAQGFYIGKPLSLDDFAAI